MDKKRKRRTISKSQNTKQNRQKISPADSQAVNQVNEDLVVTLLTRTPTIVEMIFKLLNLRELQKCSLVCKMWNQLAEIVKNQRRNPLVIYEVAVDEEGQPINVMHEYNVRRLGDIERIQYRYQLKWGSKRLLAKFEERLKNTYVDPGFGFVFCCNLRYELRYRNLNAILPHGLPPGVSLLRSYGKVSIGLPDSTRLNWPLEAERVPAISAIFFPKNMSGVEFYPFVIPKSFNTISSLPTKRRKQSKEYDNATRIPRGKKIKCLMIFKRNPYIYGKEEETIPITQYLMRKENYKLALGGLEADNIQMQNTPSRPVGLNDDETGVGLAITGEKVEAASILIEPSMRTREAVIAKLKELRDGISLKSKTVGFLFSSRHKGIEHYQVPDVESSSFQSIFPKIPLVGMTGNAIDRPGLVIGTDYFPNTCNAHLDGSSSETVKTFEHVRSSVFVLLTWG